MKSIVERVVDDLTRDGKLVEAPKKRKKRKSYRPPKEHKKLAKEYQDVADRIGKIQAAIDALKANMQQEQHRLGDVGDEILAALDQYEGQTMKAENALFRINEIAERKSPVPQWRKYVDYALGVLQTVSQKHYEEVKAKEEEFKKTFAGRKELEVEPVPGAEEESVKEEALSDEVADWGREAGRVGRWAMRGAWQGVLSLVDSAKRWARDWASSLRKVDYALDKAEALIDTTGGA